MTPSLVDLTPTEESVSNHAQKHIAVKLTQNIPKENSGQLPQGDRRDQSSTNRRTTYFLDSEAPNPSLQVTASRTIKLATAPVHRPSHDEILIHVKSTGICGSDIHFWRSGCIGPLTVEGDCILGHEAAGIIVAVGTGVKDLKPGDRVAIEPGMACETDCFLCRSGQYNLCEDVHFAGIYPIQAQCNA
jgi:L-iditol 2-dehydrogenase